MQKRNVTEKRDEGGGRRVGGSEACVVCLEIGAREQSVASQIRLDNGMDSLAGQLRPLHRFVVS